MQLFTNIREATQIKLALNLIVSRRGANFSLFYGVSIGNAMKHDSSS